MRRKPLSAEPVIQKELLEGAKRSLQTDRFARIEKCSVCEAPCPPNANSDDRLCWVCRRLKISAWRDADQQIAQE